MLKLVAVFGVLGALTAGVFLTPIGGRTVADRWTDAREPGAFVKNAWGEGRAAFTADERGPASPPSSLPGPARRSRPAPGPAPVEHHTAEDRAALDRLLSERSR
jgi:hypothetical protein